MRLTLHANIFYLSRMKNLLLLAFARLLSLGFCAQAQPSAYTSLPKDEAGKVSYTAVVPVEGVGQDDLFTRVKEWSARSFGDNKVAERMNDRAAGTLVAEVVMQQPPLSFTDTHANLYKFKVAVYVKDGRYKYQIDDFTYQNINPALFTEDAQQRVSIERYATAKDSKKTNNTLKDFDRRIQTIIENLAQSMSAARSVSKDW